MVASQQLVFRIFTKINSANWLLKKFINIKVTEILTMNSSKYQDNGGRRFRCKRRFRLPSGPVLERRRGKDRRCRIDRRKVRDPAIRIVGNERRKALRDLSY